MSDLLQELQREFSLTCLFISHSLPIVAQVATRIAVMRAGQFLEVGDAEQVLHQPKTATPANCFPSSQTFPASDCPFHLLSFVLLGS